MNCYIVDRNFLWPMMKLFQNVNSHTNFKDEIFEKKNQFLLLSHLSFKVAICLAIMIIAFIDVSTGIPSLDESKSSSMHRSAPFPKVQFNHDNFDMIKKLNFL
jgi:hypothetical protein